MVPSFLLRGIQFPAVLILLFVVTGAVFAQDDDFELQGEYSGNISVLSQKVGMQVIALGDGNFNAKLFRDGLPGEGAKVDSVEVPGGKIVDGVLVFTNENNDRERIEIAEGTATVFEGEQVLGKLKRVVRKSKTLGQSPPENATVLFGLEGSAQEMKEKYAANWEWKGKAGRVSDNGLLMEGTASREKFQSHKLHLEFRLPFQPNARGQGRGNSGLYLQGRYEIQMLDSFGLAGENNECGGIYGIRKPDINMCYPPMQWQTYDVEFRAAKFEDGKKVRDAQMTVHHNGVLIHEKVELPRITTAAPVKESAEPGPIFLQNHGNPVRYRNIWVVPLEDK